MLLSIDQLEASQNRFNAADKQPGRETLANISEESFMSDVPPEVVKGSMLSVDENMEKRKDMLEVTSKEPVDFALERAIGRNDSVYSNFIEMVLNAKRKVGRIACKKGSKTFGYATGFMVSEKLMLTNWHVFKTIDAVVDSGSRPTSSSMPTRNWIIAL
jgi:endonuclease G